MIQLDCARVIGLANNLEIVSRHNHGRACRVYVPEKLKDAARRALVEIAGWLVGKKKVRIIHERPRNRDTLLFSS